MKNMNIYDAFIETLPEGKKLPSALERDLRKVSEALERARDAQEVRDILAQHSLLRNRIAAAAGVSAAQAFDRFVNELMKKL